MSLNPGRRCFLTNTAWLLMAPMIAGVSGRFAAAENESEKDEGGDKEEVSATEDLMREHGILRRTLIVYTELAPKLRRDPSAVNAALIGKAAQLFRSFGEDYHEKKLEEAHIFPAVEKIGGKVADLTRVLLEQHKRGREITDYVVGRAAGKLQPYAAELADVLEGFVRMYRAHAAREDTILFPAWKKTLGVSALREMAEKFEDIEHQQFGKDGFDDAVRQIAAIEDGLGLSDLKIFTAPAPPLKSGAA